MSYSIKDFEPTGVVRFPLSACNDNVIVVEAKYKQVEGREGKTYELMETTYAKKMPDGIAKLNHGVYKVDEENPFMIDADDGDKQKAIKRLKNEFYQLIYWHTDALKIPREEVQSTLGESFSFKSFIENFNTLIQKYRKGNKVYLKTFKNDSGYITIPRFGCFIKPMTDQNGNVINCDLSYNDWEKKRLNSMAAIGSGGDIEEYSDNSEEDSNENLASSLDAIDDLPFE